MTSRLIALVNSAGLTYHTHPFYFWPWQITPRLLGSSKLYVGSGRGIFGFHEDVVGA